jgi:hypothetical protein
MGAFKRRDAAEAQMQQQAASYSRALACGLLAAGHQPSPWLLPHPASFAALFRRGTAEEQMRLQVEAYSKSIACALIDAGHLPPPWLLPHRAAGEGTFERSVPADARMWPPPKVATSISPPFIVFWSSCWGSVL